MEPETSQLDLSMVDAFSEEDIRMGYSQTISQVQFLDGTIGIVFSLMHKDNGLEDRVKSSS